MSFAPENLRALDTLRTRLSQLNQTLSSIARSINDENPLPSWPTLQSLQQSLFFTLTQLNETMTLNADVLKSAHVYPTGSFPGHKEGNMMMALLRKKLDVRGVEWIEEFTKDYKGSTGDGEGLGWNELEGLWSWASSCSQGVIGPMLENEDFGDDFTLAEREEGVENVRTGLRRKLWDEESGDEDEDGNGEKMDEDVMPERKEVEEGVDPELRPLPLESVLRFVTTGAVPARPNR